VLTKAGVDVWHSVFDTGWMTDQDMQSNKCLWHLPGMVKNL